MKRALVFGGVPVIAGIALIVVWALSNKTAASGSGFTQVLATIETAKVQPGAIDIAYRYEVGGREYRNPNGRLTAKRGGASRYVPGARVIAYVNPAIPTESFLERSAAAPSPSLLIAGVVLLVVGLPLGIYFLREKRSQPKPVRKAAPSMSRLKPPPSIPRR